MKHFDQDYYDEEYFKTRDECKKSSFMMPYTWENEQKNAIETAIHLITLFQPKSVFDVGCGKGFLLKALKQRGVERVHGVDISRWAVENADPEVKPYLGVADIRDGFNDLDFVFDLVVSYSTLEHIEEEYLSDILWNMKQMTKSWVYISIPVGLMDNDIFGDPSHMTIKTPGWWIDKFHSTGLNYDPRLSNMTCDDPMYNMNFALSKTMLERWIYTKKMEGIKSG